MKRLRFSVSIACAVLASGCVVGGTAMSDLMGSGDANPWEVMVVEDVGLDGEQGLLMRIDDVDAVYRAGLGVTGDEFGGHRFVLAGTAIPTALLESPPAYLHALDHVQGRFRLIMGKTSAPTDVVVDGDDFQAPLEEDLFIGFRKADGTTFATRMRGDDAEQYEWVAEDQAAANAFFAGTETIADIDILFGRSSMR